jgi:hypothetical protein
VSDHRDPKIPWPEIIVYTFVVMLFLGCLAWVLLT